MKQRKLPQQLEEVIRKQKDDTIKFDLLQELADTSVNERRLEDALAYYKRALQVAQDMGDEKRECETMIDLGFVTDDLDKTGDAIEYLHKALLIARKMRDDRAIATILTRRATLWIKMRRPDLAVIDFQKAREAADIGRAILLTDAEKRTEITSGRARRNDTTPTVIQAALKVSNRFEQEQRTHIAIKRIVFIARFLLIITIIVSIIYTFFTPPISVTKVITLGGLVISILVFGAILTFVERTFFSSPNEQG
jgi:tetratricopeptide (TPR) repeat protein